MEEGDGDMIQTWKASQQVVWGKEALSVSQRAEREFPFGTIRKRQSVIFWDI
jgi:hypothetical protein